MEKTKKLILAVAMIWGFAIAKQAQTWALTL
jgi:hypothetical protein